MTEERQMTQSETLDQAAKVLLHHANNLIMEAAKIGLILTIETLPMQPLAMGNYALKVELRNSNKVYRSQQLEVKNEQT